MLMKVQGLVDIPADEYHADKSVVGHSALVEMLKSPSHFKHRLDTPFTATPAMRLGTALHSAVLEPLTFSTQYVVSPKFDRRKTEDKEKAKEWELQHAGKSILTEEEMQAVQGMRAAVAAHKDAARMLQGCVTEQSYFWTDAETGIRCRIRPDGLVVDASGEVVAILDLKSALCAAQRPFARVMGDRGYDVQAAFYTDGLAHLVGKQVPFYLLAVENTAPHGVALYKVGQRTLEIGRSKYRTALQLLEWCRKNERWPSYQPFGDAEEIDLPHWERSISDAD